MRAANADATATLLGATMNETLELEQGYEQEVEGVIEDIEGASGATSGKVISAEVLLDEHGSPMFDENGHVLLTVVMSANIELDLKYEKYDPKTQKTNALKQTTLGSGQKSTGAGDIRGLEIFVTARAFVKNPVMRASKSLLTLRK